MRYFNGNVIIVSGPMRNGKTLYVVSGLKKLLEKEQEKPENERRKFYTDIDGLSLDGVGISPKDWRTAPCGSFIVYDECQFRDEFIQSGSSVSKYQFVRDLSIAGRKGYTIVFITQSARFLHANIRLVANQHIHVRRINGADKCLVLRYGKVILNPDSKSNIDNCTDKFVWDYDKETYGDYSSLDSTAENADYQVEKQMPAALKSVISTLIIIVFIVVFLGYTLYDDMKSGTSAFSSFLTIFDSSKKDEKKSIFDFAKTEQNQQHNEVFVELKQVRGAFIDKHFNCVLYDNKANYAYNSLDCEKHLKVIDNYADVVASRDRKVEIAIQQSKKKTLNFDSFYTVSSYR